MASRKPQKPQSESSTATDKPLREEDCDQLLLRHESIRDPVHGDIWITALERAIIDTSDFQRLRLLHQLGPTHLVYPGAVHNRFLHSIGVLQKAETLVDVVNRNHDVYSLPTLVRVEPYPHLLVRLHALLHDVAHMAFGHQLEDEGNMADGKAEWEDPERASRWLGPDAKITKAVVEFLKKMGVTPANAEAFMEDVRRYVCHEGKETGSFAYPYVVDIVGNTLCADLLDYIERDMYFCGLKDRSGDRVINYLAIMQLHPTGEVDKETGRPIEYEPVSATAGSAHESQARLVLLAYRRERRHAGKSDFQIVQKPDVLSEAIDLLRRRFALAEKVFFHRTKTAASAMIIAAVSDASFELKDVYGETDDSLIAKLAIDSHPRAKRIAERYAKRILYKAPYYISYRPPSEDPSSLELWNKLYRDFRKPDARKKLEKRLERRAKLSPGAVVTYCPAKEMNLKEFEVLVQSQPEARVKPLHNILDPSRKAEMEAVNGRYAMLWRFQVLVDPSELEPDTQAAEDFARLCEEEIGFPNSNESMRNRGLSAREQFEWRALKRYCDEKGLEGVPLEVQENLRAAVHRELPPDIDPEDAVYDILKDLMEKRGFKPRTRGAEKGQEELPLSGPAAS